MALFETIAEWQAAGMPNREIARRLKVDVKTIRRHVRKMQEGAKAPFRVSPGSKLDPYRDRIVELAGTKRTAWRIYRELREDATFTASYELVKKHVAALRVKDPRVFERLVHAPGAEVQIDFGELCRVKRDGQLMRTWAFVAVWPYSGYRYVEVVLDQTVPTFLSCVQNAFVAAQSVPARVSLDNLGAGVFRDHFNERAYQREFSLLCKHYDTMPNAVRPRTPTDKGAVENGVGALKKGLRGREFGALEELHSAVSTWAREINARPNSVSGKRAGDLIVDERRGALPEPYAIASWSEHRVRTDCHVQVRSNFYSVPYTLVGKRVVVRVDASSVKVYDKFERVAAHDRQYGRGRTTTDRGHYPPHKRKSSQEVHDDRVNRIRCAGAGVTAFYAGLLLSREHVHSDAYRALLRLVESTDAGDLDRACARAAHFENFTLAALRTILDGNLFMLPLDDLTAVPVVTSSVRADGIEIARPLSAYAALLGGAPC